MNAILLMLLLAAPEDDLRERLQRSVDAGTGGAMAVYALCHNHAVEEFADGHQTPELVTDEDVWEDVLQEGREIPFGSPVFERERTLYQELYVPFRQKSAELAREIARARDPVPPRRETKKLSTDYTKAVQELATASLARVRKALPRHQSAAFEKFIEERRHVTVVVRLDYTKIRQVQGDCSFGSR